VRDANVLILGAGPAGCAAALALLARGIDKILIVDRAAPKPFIPGESATPDIAPLLQRLGLEADLGRLGHRPYFGNLTAWGGPPALALFGRRGSGWHLDRTAFEIRLREEIDARGAVLACPARLGAIRTNANGWQVEVEGFGRIAARVIVDAGGRRAPLATRLGAKRRRLDALVALAARVPCPTGSRLEGYSFVESVADGWWYAACIPSGEAVVMLMTDCDIAAAYRDPEAFARGWREAPELSRRIAPPQDNIPPRAFAAHSAISDKSVGKGWIAVGDALMAFDPLTVSGLSGALNDAVAASAAIESMLNGDDEAPAYENRARITLHRYLAGRAAYYEMERRWPEGAFWARRARVRADTPDFADRSLRVGADARPGTRPIA
jgi:2-polyprenyl-6-methoxyphenol hydroxylase-like FAD-dependent oxidoreductase